MLKPNMNACLVIYILPNTSEYIHKPSPVNRRDRKYEIDKYVRIITLV